MPIEVSGNQAIITSDGTRRYFIVPANVKSGTVEYNLIGGGGGAGGSDSPYGGGSGSAAGIVTGTLNVNAGDLVEIIAGGGGGGATVLKINGVPKAIAAGGAGGGGGGHWNNGYGDSATVT